MNTFRLLFLIGSVARGICESSRCSPRNNSFSPIIPLFVPVDRCENSKADSSSPEGIIGDRLRSSTYERKF